MCYMCEMYHICVLFTHMKLFENLMLFQYAFALDLGDEVDHCVYFILNF